MQKSSRARQVLQFLVYFGLPAIALAGVIIGVAFAFGSKLIDKVGYVDAAVALVYPIALGLLWHYVSASRFEENMDSLEDSLASDIRSDKLILHGKKYSFPNADKTRFWNDFLLQANNSFILVGHTNKSWVKGGRRQSRLLGNSIIRIIKDSGTVRILSCSDEDVVGSNIEFLDNWVVQRVRSLSAGMVLRARESIEYVTFDDINYNAVVSDDRLVVIPRSNDGDFRENDAVIEVDPVSHNDIYENYMRDIDRIFEDANRVEINWEANEQS